MGENHQFFDAKRKMETNLHQEHFEVRQNLLAEKAITNSIIAFPLLLKTKGDNAEEPNMDFFIHNFKEILNEPRYRRYLSLELPRNAPA